MDSALEFLDDHLFDNIYSKLFPVYSNETVETLVSALPRNNGFRIFLSLFTFITVAGWFFYLSVACFSYYAFFDHETMKHPKFLKNQVRLEIESAVKAVPTISRMWNRNVAKNCFTELVHCLILLVLTVPWFWGEIKGYSKLYENPTLHGGWLYMVFSVGLFLCITDCLIYWIHRYLHHPYFYKWLHKPHHKWIVPSPFASHAFHPLDGYLQSIPYHLFVYFIPMQKWLYIVMFIFVNFWTVAIHDGNFMLRSTIINSSAHHAIHHLYFNYNYGQYFTLWDRVGGSHRQPSEEQYNDILRKDKQVWEKQARFVDSVEGETSLNNDKAM